MVTEFDVAVVGLGTMGSFACLELARRGLRVLGLDRFAPPHQHGSHSGETRVFRIAYAEHPDYVPLAKRAGELWNQFGKEAGIELLIRCGMLSMGAPESALVKGIQTSAAQHRLDVEMLSRDEIGRRFPAFALPADHVGIFEAAAGWLDVNAAIEFALQAARKAGATVVLNAPVETWEKHSDGMLLRTQGGSYAAKKVIVSAGAWSGGLLSDLKLPLVVQRKVLAWVDPLDPILFEAGRFPVFAIAERFFYGFPHAAGAGVKLAIHLEAGHVLAGASSAVAPPDESDLNPILEMAATFLPGLAGALPGARSRVANAKTCLYTMTPDEHFVIDRHPVLADVHFAAGFSGHGFKFAPAVGEALADLAMGRSPKVPIDFLRRGGRF